MPYHYPFRYLPSVAYTLALPLNLIEAWSAYWLWVGFNELLLVINVVLTWRAASSTWTKAAGVFAWLAFSPFYLELFMGQFSFLMASLFFWTGLALQEGKFRVAGTAWLTSLLVKSNSLLFVPIWLRAGKPWVIVAAFVVVAGLNAPYFLMVDGSWDAWLNNFAAVTERAAPHTHPGALGLPSLLEIVEQRATGGSWTEQLAGTFAALPWAVAIVGITATVTFLGPGRRPAAMLAAWICVHFLVFGEVWEHHYVMALAALVLLFLYEPGLRPVVMLSYVLMALPTPYYLFQQDAPALDYTVVDPQLYWSSVEIGLHHLSKVGPLMLVWLSVIVSLSRDVRLPAKVRSVRGRIGSTLRPTTG